MTTANPYADKQAAVLGLGSSGEAAARLLLSQGAHVHVLDGGDGEKLRASAASLREAGAIVTLGAEVDALLATENLPVVDLCVLSPGIDPAVPLVRCFQDKGVRIIGELELAYTLCPVPVIGITGTNGKTTTTQLVERMLNACGIATVAAGNIGTPLSARISDCAALKVATLEISSFQLEAIETFRPKIAVWLNFEADHLDRYPSMKEYYEAKVRIFENQTAEDVAIIKLGSKLPPLAARTITFSAYEPGGDFEFRDGVIHLSGAPVLRLTDTQLRGLHNVENLMAALAVGVAMGADFSPMIEALCTYRALPHRCELIRTVAGVDYVNDSKATNLDALEKALVSETRPVVLIAGGKDKGFEFDSLTPLVAQKARTVVLIGEMAARIESFWGSSVPCVRATDFPGAVRLARQHAQTGDVVLLSPGTSSFDMFKSYADRGDQFRQLVHALEQ